MVQPVRRGRAQNKVKSSVKKLSDVLKDKKTHPKYGTSKLEDIFAENFLDVLGVKYVRQYEATDIGRYYDFRIIGGPIIEINGSYWHGDKRLYEEKDLNGTQRRNIKIDEIKRRWAENNGIKIYYFWEKDIHENPEKIMSELKEIVREYRLKIEKNKRH